MSETLSERALAHILFQARSGEFGVLDDEAGTMSAVQFAQRHDAPIALWEDNSDFWCVPVDGVDYLWCVENGVYDGWNFDVVI